MPRPTITRPALGIDGNGDYCGDRDGPTAVANLQVSGVEPAIRPFSVYFPSAVLPLPHGERVAGAELVEQPIQFGAIMCDPPHSSLQIRVLFNFERV
jgi:hypothetical protein